MRPGSRPWRPTPWLTVGAVLVATLTACDSGEGSAQRAAPTSAASSDDAAVTGADAAAAVTAAPSADEAPPMETEDPDPADATGTPSVTQDFEDDAGQDIQDYDYPDDPEPADSVVQTLCNLDREYFTSVRASSNGVDENLRLASLGVSDLISSWQTLIPHYPDVEDDVETAVAIQAAWDEAIIAQENGEDAAARAALAEADGLIASLPASSHDACDS